MSTSDFMLLPLRKGCLIHISIAAIEHADHNDLTPNRRTSPTLCEGLQTAHRAAIMRAGDRAGLPHYYLQINTHQVPFHISKKQFAAIEHADHNDLTPANRSTSPTLL